MSLEHRTTEAGSHAECKPSHSPSSKGGTVEILGCADAEGRYEINGRRVLDMALPVVVRMKLPRHVEDFLVHEANSHVLARFTATKMTAEELGHLLLATQAHWKLGLSSELIDRGIVACRANMTLSVAHMVLGDGEKYFVMGDGVLDEEATTRKTEWTKQGQIQLPESFAYLGVKSATRRNPPDFISWRQMALKDSKDRSRMLRNGLNAHVLSLHHPRDGSGARVAAKS